MKIDVRVLKLESPPTPTTGGPPAPLADTLRAHAVRRARFHFSRFAHELNRVVLRVADINGPRGGVDKQCRVTVSGPRVAEASLDVRSTDPFAAVDEAVDRMARSVARQLERARSRAT
jgi:putative sigma-54 modulation protein